MFTLRKITQTGVEMNFNLGDSYTLVTKENSPEEFEKRFKRTSVLWRYLCFCILK